MNPLIRCMTDDGNFLATAIDSGDLVHAAQTIHRTNSVATAALGRLLTAAAMMGVMLKEERSSVTVKIDGGGPLGMLTAIADNRGHCRGSISHPEVVLPLQSNGKLDVGGAVGKTGTLLVIRNQGQGEPYIGQIGLVSGEIAEDVTHYFAVSEQIPTVCALGVLVDKTDQKVLLAGGLLVQALPGTDDDALTHLEQNLMTLPSVTTMLAQGLSPEDMCRKALEGFGVSVLEECAAQYACPCSHERVKRALCSMPAAELLEIAQNEGKLEATCQYCGRQYEITKSELESLAAIQKNREV